MKQKWLCQASLWFPSSSTEGVSGKSETIGSYGYINPSDALHIALPFLNTILETGRISKCMFLLFYIYRLPIWCDRSYSECEGQPRDWEHWASWPVHLLDLLGKSCYLLKLCPSHPKINPKILWSNRNLLTIVLLIWLKDETPKRFWIKPCWTFTPIHKNIFSPFSSKYMSPFERRSSEFLIAVGKESLFKSTLVCRDKNWSHLLPKG